MKKAAIGAVLLALVSSVSHAQSNENRTAAPISLPAEGSRVAFMSLDGATNLEAYLFAPAVDGNAAHPAAVMMHGCSGLLQPNKNAFFPLYRPWVRALTGAGYVVLVMDSASPRGLGQTCTGPASEQMWRERPKDAYAALAYLEAQPFVRADRVALMGWSQGGGAALLAINERTAARQSPRSQEMLSRLPHDFRAAVAFYPGACREDFHRRTYPPGERVGWTSKVPLMVLFGDADTWTELAPCRTFLDAAQARGNPIEMKVYAGAAHAFDAPNLPRLELPQYRTSDGRVPVLQTDAEARADAFARVLGFLRKKLME